MSTPTEYGDGPLGQEPLITLSRRTLTLVIIAALALFFALGTITWVMFGIYRNAVHDRDIANANTTCARQLNADAVSTIGFTITALGDLNSQLGTTIKQLVTPNNFAAFATEAGKLQPLSDVLENQAQVTKAKLNDLQQVNDICTEDNRNG